MSELVNRLCHVVCSIIRLGRSPISKEFSNKAKQLRKDVDGDNEYMTRLEILTEEMSVKSNDIRSHEMLLKIAADSLDSPIWGKDIDNNFVFMNISCATKICKTSLEDALREPEVGHVMTPIEEVCLESDTLVQNTMKTHRFFEHAMFDDGSDIWLDTTKSPWLVNGKLVGSVGMGKDISEYIPEDVRESCSDSGYIEIDVDLMYNSDDIRGIVCK